MMLDTMQVGDGHPLYVFLHGLFGRGRNWTTIARALLPTASLLVDLPNHGYSPWTMDFSYPDMADAVAGVLGRLDTTGHPVTLVGHSMGGKVAMLTALRERDLVSRLVVEDVAPLREPLDDLKGYVAALRGLDLAHLASRADAAEALAGPIPDPRVRDFLLQGLRHGLTGNWSWQFNLQVLGDHLDDIADWPATDAAFDGPVLWILGKNSKPLTPARRAAMQTCFPRARTVTVRGAGHWVHTDAPGVYVETLRAFAAL